MLIIKDSEDHIQTIAGEMLNIELSVKHYVDGKPVPAVAMTTRDYRGYPKIIRGNVIEEIRAAAGYIFVPVDVDLDEFRREIEATILRLETTVANHDGSDPKVLRKYHTVRSSYNTNVKVASELSLTVADDNGVNGRTKKNIKRLISTRTPDGESRRGRFNWFIRPMNEVMCEITDDNTEDVISRFASVFYDRDDICTYSHNQTVTLFTKNNFKGAANIICEPEFKIFKYGYPLMFELSDHWRSEAVSANAREFLRNINPSKIFSIDYDKLEYKPVSMEGADTDTSAEICSACRSVMFGENYALAGPVTAPDSPLCTAICPLCLHRSPLASPIESKYFRVYRVIVPRKDTDLIDDLSISPDRRELRKEVLKKVERKSLTVNGKEVRYIMIGDKFASFDDINDYLFTKLSTMTEFGSRKICESIMFIE